MAESADARDLKSRDSINYREGSSPSIPTINMTYYFQITRGLTKHRRQYPELPWQNPEAPHYQSSGGRVFYKDKIVLYMPYGTTYEEVNRQVDSFFQNKLRKKKLQAL